jgi:hypothetical protein
MPKIKLVKKKTNEMSGTGGSASATPGTGAQYATRKAGAKVAADYNKTFGTHFAPFIPNRPSKAITYKELWEAGEYESLAGILKQLGAEADSIKVLLKAVEMGALKPSDAVIITKKALGLKEEIQEGLGNEDGLDNAARRAEELIKLKNKDNPLIREARYSEFKKMTQVRTPGEQLHRAIREIRRKIDEINKLVSYTEKMKTEMKSDVSEVNYLKRTKEALAKISARIQETNNKIKRLVQ